MPTLTLKETSRYQISHWLFSASPLSSWEPIVKYVNEQYEKYLIEELHVNRKRRIPDSRVHCCIYFLPATGHRWVHICWCSASLFYLLLQSCSFVMEHDFSSWFEENTLEGIRVITESNSMFELDLWSLIWLKKKKKLSLVCLFAACPIMHLSKWMVKKTNKRLPFVRKRIKCLQTRLQACRVDGWRKVSFCSITAGLQNVKVILSF